MSVDRQADALRRRPAPNAIAPAPMPPLLTVLGAKGGVGKTSLAVNLALLSARQGQRTLLVDLDPGCGDVGVHLRLDAPFGLDDLVAGACSPQQAVVPGPAGLHVLLAAHGGERLAAPNAATVAKVFDAIARAAQGFDVVICDTGAGIGPLGAAAAERADLALAVTTPDPAAVTDTYALFKVLHRRGRALPQLVVNGCRSREDAMRTAARLCAVSRRFLATDCTLLGWIRRDAQFERSACEQRPLALGEPAAVLDDVRAVHAACRSLLPALPARAANAVRTLHAQPHAAG